MCTVLLGRDVTGPGEILIGANRDEDPSRPSDPPGILLDSPRLVGGRDRVAGGTWLAVRVSTAPTHSGRASGEAGSGVESGSGGEAGWKAEAGASVTMLLNRRPQPHAPVPARSRGLLVIDVARADDPRTTARAEAASGRYGPCTLVHVSTGACWWLAIAGDGTVRSGEIAAGWHAITHAELDDATEPRTAWLVGQLAAVRARAAAPALERLASLLAHHGDATTPPVCLHEGRMPTVSSALIAVSHQRVVYRHAEGRPCTQPFVDVFLKRAPDGAVRRAGRPAPPGPPWVGCP